MKTYEEMVQILAKENYEKIKDSGVYFMDLHHIHTVFEVSSEQLRTDIAAARNILLFST